jgi:diguanylate cyclase (GGDEF)-like protein
MRASAISVLVLLLAGKLAHADGDIVRQLSETYRNDSKQTLDLAERFLQDPARLTTRERFEAQAYRCEALEDLDRVDEAIERSGQDLHDVPLVLATDEAEPVARLHTCAGYLAKRKGNLREALADYNRAQAVLDPRTGWLTLSYALYRRASLYDTLGNHADALADLTRALELLKDRERNADVDAQYNNIASAIARIHMHRGDYDKALPYELDLLEYTRRMADAHAEAAVQINLGECYRGLNRLDDAAKAYGQVLDIGTRIDNKTYIGRANVGLGAVARAHKDYAASLKYFDAARTAFAANDVKLEAANADLERAQTLADSKDWRALAKLSASLLAELEAIGDKHLLRQAHQLKARAEEGSGDLAAALADERDSARLQDEIQRSEFDDELAKRSVQFDVAQLEDKARSLARESEFAQAKATREHEINLLQRGIILLAAAAVALLVASVRKHLKTGRLLTRLANEDALTGIDNRRATLIAADSAFVRSRTDGSPLPLALIDIDYFKQINDRYGHAVGDTVLVEVAACLRARLRNNDICGRIGGEEFLLALPGLDLAAATAILERLREAVGALRFATPADELRVAFSAGCTLRTADDDSLETLVRRADAALYAAKRGGRGRTQVQPTAAAVAAT